MHFIVSIVLFVTTFNGTETRDETERGHSKSHDLQHV